MRYLSGFAISAALLALLAGDAEPAESGVIFMYHHVDTQTPASTSVRPDEFVEQIEWLEREGFTVLPLLELLDSLDLDRSLPDKAVSITFDDAYSSVLSTAMPVLRERNWPFTVFVSTQAIDQRFRGYLNWDELRLLGQNGATFGNHSVSHAHLIRQEVGESPPAWEERVTREIQDARARLIAELGEQFIPVFAYPYGEYTVETRELLAGIERFGLGQHSGAAGPRSDLLALPRYPVATGLGLAEFGLRASSRALPVSLVEPERHIVTAGQERPPLHLALAVEEDIQVEELACYASGQGRMSLQWLNEERTEFITRPEMPLRAGRSKINCTAPSKTRSDTWYWYGYVWMHRRPDGRWYEE